MTVLCVNANAALDKTLLVNHFSLSKIHRPQEVLVLPGGKGSNVARALRTMGVTAILTGWIGGYSGRFIEDRTRQEGVETKFIYTSHESRECISILDPVNGTTTEIYEKGSPITTPQVEEFYSLFDNLLNDVKLVTLSGSIPPGVPIDFYTTLIQSAGKKAVPVLLDTSGEVLLNTFIKGQPYLIKPNRTELQDILPGIYLTLNQLASAVCQLSKTVNSHIAVSVGADGLIYAEDGKVWLASSPKINPVSAVGSGDCLLAGLAIGYINGWSISKTLQIAVGMGSANTLEIGAGLFKREVAEELAANVLVEAL